MWDLGVILLSLGLLMYTAYRGFSVILMAPICALLAVLLINPANVLPFYSGVFMPKMVGFIKDYGGVSKSMLKKSRLNFDKIEKCK